MDMERQVPRMMLSSDRLNVISVDTVDDTIASHLSDLQVKIPYHSYADQKLETLNSFAIGERDQIIVFGEIGSLRLIHSCFVLLQLGYHVFAAIDAVENGQNRFVQRLIGAGVIVLDANDWMAEIQYTDGLKNVL